MSILIKSSRGRLSRRREDRWRKEKQLLRLWPEKRHKKSGRASRCSERTLM